MLIRVLRVKESWGWRAIDRPIHISYCISYGSWHRRNIRAFTDREVPTRKGLERKAPNEILDENVKAQGISYTRLLKSGGITPFVVITNGHETQIYDSITEEAMQDAYIPINHRHAQNRFRVSMDDMTSRAEALETFVSLSSDNLLAFCRAQVAQRMRVLRSDDPFSGKKYIPALYIEREDTRKQLHRLVDEERRQVVLLASAPQVGKTNFVCHSIEERLGRGQLLPPVIRVDTWQLSNGRL